MAARSCCRKRTSKADELAPQVLLFSSGELNLFELTLRRDRTGAGVRIAPSADRGPHRGEDPGGRRRMSDPLSQASARLHADRGDDRDAGGRAGHRRAADHHLLLGRHRRPPARQILCAVDRAQPDRRRCACRAAKPAVGVTYGTVDYAAAAGAGSRKSPIRASPASLRVEVRVAPQAPGQTRRRRQQIGDSAHALGRFGIRLSRQLGGATQRHGPGLELRRSTRRGAGGGVPGAAVERSGGAGALRSACADTMKTATRLHTDRSAWSRC